MSRWTALRLKFNFKGKSGKVWKLNVRDRRIAKVIQASRNCPVRSCFSMSTRTARYTTSPQRM